MLCVEIMKLDDRVLPEDWNYFMRGATGAQIDFPAKPDVAWLQPWQWHEACKLDVVLPAFRGLKDDITATPCSVTFGDNNVVRFLSCISTVRAALFVHLSLTSPYQHTDGLSNTMQ